MQAGHDAAHGFGYFRQHLVGVILVGSPEGHRGVGKFKFLGILEGHAEFLHQLLGNDITRAHELQGTEVELAFFHKNEIG